MLPWTRPIHFPHDRRVLLAFHLLLCQSPMTCATPQGGEGGGGLHIGKLQPYPKLGRRGGLLGFCCDLSYLPSQIVSGYGCQVHPSSQVAVVLSLNQVGLVAMGMWSEEVWLQGTLVWSVCFCMHALPALPVMFQLPEVFFMECLVVPAIKSQVRGVKR